jgi:hypothetical protein
LQENCASILPEYPNLPLNFASRCDKMGVMQIALFSRHNRPLLAFAILACLLQMLAPDLHADESPSSQPSSPKPAPLPPGMTSIFDGSTLAGWIADPVHYPSLSSASIADAGSLVRKMQAKADPVSAFLDTQLDDAGHSAVAALANNPADMAQLKALLKNLNRVINGPLIYGPNRFAQVTLSPKTSELLLLKPTGQDDISWRNRLLLDDAYPAEIHAASDTPPWIVTLGALVSTGAGRGVLYTQADYSRYRIIFDMRHISGNPNHQACVLIFCTRPAPGEKGMDALGGIQFQVPNGGHWDYRKGKNNGGGAEFTTIQKGSFDIHQWSRVEILVDATTGTARMAVAQPPGAKAVEILDFKDSSAGQNGPFALQMHNAGLFDEYANVAVEENPAVMDLVTTK